MDEAVMKTLAAIAVVATVATLIGLLAVISEYPGFTMDQRKVDHIMQVGISLVLLALLVLSFVIAFQA